MKVKTMVMDDFTKWEHVNDKETGAKHQTLGDTLADSGGERTTATVGHKFFPVRGYDSNQERAVSVRPR